MSKQDLFYTTTIGDASSSLHAFGLSTGWTENTSIRDKQLFISCFISGIVDAAVQCYIPRIQQSPRNEKNKITMRADKTQHVMCEQNSELQWLKKQQWNAFMYGDCEGVTGALLGV